MNETLSENWTFSDIPYTRPDMETLQARYDALTRRAKAAGTAEELLQVVRERDALQQEVSLCQSIATIRAFHDVTDAFYQREMQETLPQLEMLDSQSLAMAVAESPFAPAVDEAFGPRLRELLTLDHRIHAEGKELQARIAQLSAQYQQRVASAKYRVQGETLSGGQLRAALASPDRSRRKAAFEAQPVTDYVGLSPDLAEVHSKTMELLSQPYARDFFGDQAGQFLTEHRYDFIKELCAFCSIHTFETWIYEHPDASLAEWAEMFDRTERSFGRSQNNEPWREQMLAGCDLFTNTPLYMFPRYVVSYALSIVCAQQLKAAYDADPAAGWARYRALCASGGSKPYAETLEDAGLSLPFAPRRGGNHGAGDDGGNLGVNAGQYSKLVCSSRRFYEKMQKITAELLNL